MAQLKIVDTNAEILKTEMKKVLEKVLSTKDKKKAIIVAGDSLVKIDEDQELRELFLKAAEKVDVVLACRVSPK